MLVCFGWFFFLLVWFITTVQQASILVPFFRLTPKFLTFQEEFSDRFCSGSAANSKTSWLCTPTLHAMAGVFVGFCCCWFGFFFFFGRKHLHLLWLHRKKDAIVYLHHHHEDLCSFA